jgi:vesicle-fusing ATPase
VTYTKMISSESLIGMIEFAKIKIIKDIFSNAYKSKVSLIIIDDIERLLEYVHVGSRFNNNVLQCFLTYLKKLPEKIGHKLIIIGTTSRKDVMKELGIWDCFNLKIEIPSLHGNTEIQSALSQMIPSADLSSLSIDQRRAKDIPIKSLYFIANVINQKLTDNPHADVESVFSQVLAQTEMD